MTEQDASASKLPWTRLRGVNFIAHVYVFWRPSGGLLVPAMFPNDLRTGEQDDGGDASCTGSKAVRLQASATCEQKLVFGVSFVFRRAKMHLGT